jgi:MFS family permease
MIKRLFPILAISVFAAALGTGIMTPLIPLFARDLGATGIWIGVVVASYSISRAIFMPVIGRISDRKGRKLVIIIGLIISTIASLSYIWTESFTTLAIIRIVHGVAMGMIIPIAKAYVGDYLPKGEEGKWMGYFNSSLLTGLGLGPLVGGFLSENLGLTFTFLLMGGLSLLGLLVITFALPRNEADKDDDKPKPSFKKIGESKMVRGILSLQIVEAVGRSTYFAFLPIYAGIVVGLQTAQIGIIISVYVLLSALLQAVSGRFIDKINRKIVVVIGGFITVIFLILTSFAQNFLQLLLISVFGSMGAALIMPAISALVVEQGRRLGMASVMAVISISIGMGMAIGPLLGGAVVDLAGVSWAFFCAAIIFILGIGIFFRFTHQNTDITQE